MGEQTPEQAFIDAYNSLCKSMGLVLVAKPEFIPRDDGTFSIVVRFQVVPMPKQA